MCVNFGISGAIKVLQETANGKGADIDVDGKIGPKSSLDKTQQIGAFVTDYGFGKDDAGRIWDFGPLQCGPNILVD